MGMDLILVHFKKYGYKDEYYSSLLIPYPLLSLHPIDWFIHFFLDILRLVIFLTNNNLYLLNELFYFFKMKCINMNEIIIWICYS